LSDIGNGFNIDTFNDCWIRSVLNNCLSETELLFLVDKFESYSYRFIQKEELLTHEIIDLLCYYVPHEELIHALRQVLEHNHTDVMDYDESRVIYDILNRHHVITLADIYLHICKRGIKRELAKQVFDGIDCYEVFRKALITFAFEELYTAQMPDLVELKKKVIIFKSNSVKIG
jgi:hypothetical protein